jgi:hypothetical protein
MNARFRVLPVLLLVAGGAWLVGGCGAQGSTPTAAAQTAPAAPAPDPGAAPAPADSPVAVLSRGGSVGLLRLGHMAPEAPAFDVFFAAIGQDSAQIGSGGYPDLTRYMTLPPGRYVWSMRPAGSPPSTPMTLTKLVTVKAGEASTAVLFNDGPQGSLQGKAVEDALAAPAAGQGLVRVIQGAVGEPVPVTIGDRPAQSLAYGTITPYQAAPSGELTVSSPTASAPAVLRVAPGSMQTVTVTRGPDGVRLTSVNDTVAALTPAATAAPVPPTAVNTGSGGAAATGTWPPPYVLPGALAGGALLVAGLVVAALRRGRPRHRA